MMEKREQKLFHIKKDNIMAQKQEKKIKIDSDILYDLQGDLNKCLKYLKDIPKIHPDFYRFELDIENNYNYDTSELVLYGYRWETDNELAYRLEKAKKKKERDTEKKAQKLDEEREEYERLKKKFESPKPFGNY